MGNSQLNRYLTSEAGDPMVVSGQISTLRVCPLRSSNTVTPPPTLPEPVPLDQTRFGSVGSGVANPDSFPPTGCQTSRGRLPPRPTAAAGAAPAPAAAAALVGEPTRTRVGTAVLFIPVDAIGNLIVDGHVVDLRDGEIDVRPHATVVDAEADPAVVGHDHPIRIGGIDPHVVVVAAGTAAERREGAAAVEGVGKVVAEEIQLVLVAG